MTESNSILITGAIGGVSRTMVDMLLEQGHPVRTFVRSDDERAPIAGYDVAELCAKILADPMPHIGKSYALTGPEYKDMHAIAEDFSAALSRPITYVPIDIETWNETYIDPALGEYPHTAEHLKTLTRIIGNGGYGRARKWGPSC